MDTDYLSNETYEGVILTVEKFFPNVTSQFAVLANHCKNETEYLKEVIELVNEFIVADEETLEDFFYGEVPPAEDITLFASDILSNINKINSLPIDRRQLKTY